MFFDFKSSLTFWIYNVLLLHLLLEVLIAETITLWIFHIIVLITALLSLQSVSLCLVSVGALS